MPALPDQLEEPVGYAMLITGLILCVIGIVLMFFLGSKFYLGLIPCIPGGFLMAIDAYDHEFD